MAGAPPVGRGRAKERHVTTGRPQSTPPRSRGDPAAPKAAQARGSPWQRRLPVCSAPPLLPLPASGVSALSAGGGLPGRAVQGLGLARGRRRGRGACDLGVRGRARGLSAAAGCSSAAMESGGRPSLGQFILLGSSSVVTAFLYSVYRRKAQVAQELKGAKKIHLGEDLKSILSEAPGKCVPYAVIEGAVRSVKETLNSQFVENCKGVIQRLTLQEHKMVWNRTTHLWNDCSKIIHQRTNTVPFDLVPHEEGVDVAVRVLKPLDSLDLGLETVYEKFHPSIQSFTDVIGHYISGERPKGIQETEEMLKVGATLTGVGELVLDNNSVRLQPPKQGMQYYLSSQDFDSLLQRQESSVRLWKVLTLVFGFATCATLFFILRKQYLQRQERLRLKQLEEEFREQEAQLLSRASPEDRESLKNACVVCLSSFRSCVFLECGHVCSCRECYHALPEPKRCPICRQDITRALPLYNS